MWHTSIPAFLSDEIEKVQKRAFRIFYPEIKYDEALVLYGCPSLSERRSLLFKKTFEKICQPTSRLNNLVPEIRANTHDYELRNQTFLCQDVELNDLNGVLFLRCVLVTAYIN